MKTSEHILMVGQKLFQQQGFKRTKINQICQYANLSRVTFYKHFTNKDELIIAVLSRHISASTHLFAVFETSDLSLKEKVAKLIAVKIEESKRFTDKSLLELFTCASPTIEQFIQQQAYEQQKQLANMFEQGRLNNEIRKDLSDEFLFYVLDQLKHWFEDPVFDQIMPVFEDKVAHCLNFFFFGIQNNEHN